jgi:hypothetical protein
MQARHVQIDEKSVDSVKGRIGRSNTAADWLHETMIHLTELELELKNLLHILDTINESNKRYFEKDIPILVEHINVQIIILQRYYKDFELNKLDERPFKNVIQNYLNYNSAKLESLKKLASTAKFSYN